MRMTLALSLTGPSNRSLRIYGANTVMSCYVMTYLGESPYNEVVVDGRWWDQHLPDVIEAVFGNDEVNRKFLAAFGLSPSTHPHVWIDPWNWREFVRS